MPATSIVVKSLYYLVGKIKLGARNWRLAIRWQSRLKQVQSISVRGERGVSLLLDMELPSRR